MSKILIVEDEEHIASFIQKGLRKHQFMTAVATDGERALQAIEETAYDIMLLDLGLPVKDGWTVLKELRTQGNTLPVIVVTACAVTPQESLAAGANDHLLKPFRFKRLLTAVQRQIDSLSS